MTLNTELLNIYADYLITSFGLTTASGLSESLDGQISNDKISRFLGGNYERHNKVHYTEYTSKDLWAAVKEGVRIEEHEDAIIAIDDSVEEKPYTDENEVITWHFDHCSGRKVKGVNMLNFLYLGKKLNIPLSFEIIKKPIIITEEKVHPKTGKVTTVQKRKAEVTKNQLVHKHIGIIMQNRVKFKHIIFDLWFGSSETLNLIHGYQKYYVCPLKRNRKIALSERDKQQGKWIKLENLKGLETKKPIEVWLEGVNHSVLLTKQVFRNKGGSVGEMYLITNDFSLDSREKIYAIYQKRWKVEEFYKSVKSNLGLSKSPTKHVISQVNHFFLFYLCIFPSRGFGKGSKSEESF